MPASGTSLRTSAISAGWQPSSRAASAATKEIGLAVMATTLSLVIIFLPVVQALLAKGAEVEARNHDGNTALTLAETFSHCASATR